MSVNKAILMISNQIFYRLNAKLWLGLVVGAAHRPVVLRMLSCH